MSMFAILEPFPEIRIGISDKENPQSEKGMMEALGASAFAALHQEHGNRTIVVRSATDRSEKADGMITDAPGLLLTIRWADCQNFVIAVPKKGVVGVLHAGWRGVAKGAIPNFFAVLKHEWAIDPAEAFVAAGPSLCTACAEFSDPVSELSTVDRRFFHGRNVDLRGAADAQFLELGVRQDRMERMQACTKCENARYWSHRGGDRDAVAAGKGNRVGALLV